MRKKIRHLTACLAAGVLVAAAPLSGGCSQGTPPAAESTAPAAAETVPAEQAGLLLRVGLNRVNYAGNSDVEAWIARCAEDDTGAFDAFVLYSAYEDGESTTHRYLILRTETSAGIVPTGRVLRRTENGVADCELEITYAYRASEASAGGELLLVTVTLPAGDLPALTLLSGEEALSYRLTRTGAPLDPVL